MVKSNNGNYVGKIVKILPTFIFLFMSVFSSVAAEPQTYKIPDFDYPLTVESASDSLLKESIRKQDDVMILRSVLNLCVARNELTSSDGIVANLNLIDSVIPVLSLEYKSLAFIIQGEILNQVYLSNTSVFNKRNLPIEKEYPEDPMQWSSQMFRSRILALADSATQSLSILPDIELGRIKILITGNEDAEKFGLNLPGFIAFKTWELLKPYLSESTFTIIPFYPKETSRSIEGEISNKAELILTDILTRYGAAHPVVKAIAHIQFLNLLPYYEKEKYLDDAYMSLADTEGAGILLYEMRRIGNSTAEETQEKKMYHLIKEWLDRYPKGYGWEQLKYILSTISSETIEAQFPKVSLPLSPIKGQLKVANLSDSYLLIYKLSKNEYSLYDELILKKFNSRKQPVAVIETHESGEIPYNYEKEIELSGLTPGLYAVIPSKTKTLPSNFAIATSRANYSTFRVSDISIVTSNNSNEKDSGRIYVVNARNQQPVKGATVKYYKGVNSKPVGTLITNEEGFVEMPSGYYQILATYGNSDAKAEAGFNYYAERETVSSHISILTDLAVYRPGDTIEFGVVGWSQEKYSNSLQRGKEVEIALRDPNYIEVGSVSVLLNEDGRASGKILIPEGRLLGQYTLTAKYKEEKGTAGNTFLSVEEYKLPPFLISLARVKVDDEETIKFTGHAATYAGMPVANADVAVKVEYYGWSRWFAPNNSYYNEGATTDSNGEFSIELPLENLKGTIFETGRYSIITQVTSLSGESESSAPLYFSLGRGYEIRPDINNKTEIEGKTLKLHVPVYDIVGLPVKTHLNYRIVNLYSQDLVIEGKFTSPVLELAADSLPSGKYRIEFSAEDAENVSLETVIVRKDSLEVPYPTSLWIPAEQYAYYDDQKNVEVNFGSYWPDWLLYFLTDGEKTIKSGWISPENKNSDLMRILNIEILEPGQTLFLSICGLHDFKASSASIKIVPAKSLEKMEIETVSFRDMISSGEKESWSFKFKINSMPIPCVNVFAVMTDKALNAIKDFKWSLNIFNRLPYNRLQLNPQRFWDVTSYYHSELSYPRHAVGDFIPSWQTYGYPLFSGLRARGVLYRSMATKNAKAEMMDSMDSVQTMVEEEAAMAADTGGMGANDKNDKIKFRPVEMPLVFFKPDLKTNDEGIVTIDFTVPNFNTTWQLQLAGYDTALKNAAISLEAVASKPVMVKTNLPMFLRTGDVAEISATLYNNSPDSIKADGGIEVIDAMTGKEIAGQTFSQIEISPGESKVISIGFTVPEDLTCLIVKSYVAGKAHTDAEQGYVAVMPSSTPVTESTVFYVKTNQENVEVKIPKFPKGSNVTLKYCDNPAFEVLLSLPSMQQENCVTSPSLAAWLYSSLISAEIINSDENITQSLKKIFASSDSTLTSSRLLKDGNLKIVALENTPWINNANAETQRIRNLEKYFDKEALAANVKGKTDALGKLQNSDGGFSWCPGMRSSAFITLKVISFMGYLNQYGLLSDELKDMTRKAVKYYDAYIADYLARNKKFDYLYVMNYLYVRNLTGVSSSGKINKIAKECCDSLKVNRKHWDLGQKAKAALILSSNDPDKGNRRVNDLISSIQQYPVKNLPFDQALLILELYQKTNPGSEEIDRITESLFLRKETQDWGNRLTTPLLVKTLLSLKGEMTGRKEPEIYVNNQLLSLPESQSLTGNYTLNLDPDLSGKGKVTIKREKGIPAWGGIIAQYISPIKDVKASRVEDLAIIKKAYRETPEGKVEEVKYFNKGDKINIVLEIDCKKDMDYVVLADSRAACLKTDDSTSGIVNADGIFAYREIGKEKTIYYIENLKKGKYVISYSCHAERAGEYALGIAEIQSLYSPSQVSHSAGNVINILSDCHL